MGLPQNSLVNPLHRNTLASVRFNALNSCCSTFYLGLILQELRLPPFFIRFSILYQMEVFSIPFLLVRAMSVLLEKLGYVLDGFVRMRIDKRLLFGIEFILSLQLSYRILLFDFLIDFFLIVV